MAEWLVEEGIGEERAVRLTRDDIVEARLRWPGALEAGEIADGKLIAKQAGRSRGTLRFPSGEEALIDGLPASLSQGSTVRALILRPAIAEQGRTKLAHAKPTSQDPRAPLSLAASLSAEGHIVRIVRQFPGSGWDDLLADAFARELTFDGGSIVLSPTPAMTLIDIDGRLPAAQLALAAVPAIANALLRLDIHGSVGIDFPTLGKREDRQAVDVALGQALGDWPHERTAMNGFGFVQLVARFQRPSILHLATHRRAQASALSLLRRAERVEQAGAILLTCAPAVKAMLRDDWIAELARRTGREIRIATDPALALEAAMAQAVAA